MESMVKFSNKFYKNTIYNEVANIHKQELFTDVILACGDEVLPANKIILNIWSDYFKTLLTKIKLPNPVFIIKDVKPETMTHILNYIYLGEVILNKTEADLFVEGAIFLKIKGFWPAKALDKNLQNNLKRSTSRSNDPTSKKRKASSPILHKPGSENCNKFNGTVHADLSSEILQDQNSSVIQNKVIDNDDHITTNKDDYTYKRNFFHSPLSSNHEITGNYKENFTIKEEDEDDGNPDIPLSSDNNETIDEDHESLVSQLNIIDSMEEGCHYNPTDLDDKFEKKSEDVLDILNNILVNASNYSDEQILSSITESLFEGFDVSDHGPMKHLILMNYNNLASTSISISDVQNLT